MWRFVFLRKSIRLKFIPSQAELFQFIPIIVSEPMRIIPNQSEQNFVSRLIKNSKKSIRFNPIQSKASIRMNPNQVFNSSQSELGLIQTEFSIRIILNESEGGMIRIDASDLIRFIFNRFSSKEIQPFFGLVRNDSHWLRYRYQNKSE